MAGQGVQIGQGGEERPCGVWHTGRSCASRAGGLVAVSLPRDSAEACRSRGARAGPAPPVRCGVREQCSVMGRGAGRSRSRSWSRGPARCGAVRCPGAVLRDGTRSWHGPALGARSAVGPKCGGAGAGAGAGVRGRGNPGDVSGKSAVWSGCTRLSPLAGRPGCQVLKKWVSEILTEVAWKSEPYVCRRESVFESLGLPPSFPVKMRPWYSG